MTCADEAALLRRRLAEALEAVLRTVTVVTYPTVAKAMYAVQFVDDLQCAETEGAAPTLNLSGVTEYALNLGTAIPPNGTAVLADLFAGLWVFRYDG
jgi:hypothetical protein